MIHPGARVGIVKNPRKRAFGVHRPGAVPKAGDSQYCLKSFRPETHLTAVVRQSGCANATFAGIRKFYHNGFKALWLVLAFRQSIQIQRIIRVCC